MTPSDLKYHVENAGHDSHFFDRKSMKFAGDTMANYGVRAAVIRSDYDENGTYQPAGCVLEVWELFRRRPVKHGLTASAYFDASTFRRVFNRED